MLFHPNNSYKEHFSQAEMAEEKAAKEEVVLERIGKDEKFYEIKRMENIHNYESLIVLGTLDNIGKYIEKWAKEYYPGKKFSWNEKDSQNYVEERGKNNNFSSVVVFRYNPLVNRKFDGIIRKKSLEKTIEQH